MAKIRQTGKAMELLTTYLDSLRDLNLAPATIRTRKYLLQPYVTWLGGLTPTKNNACEFLRAVQNESKCVSSYNVLVGVLNSFLGYCSPLKKNHQYCAVRS